MASDDEEFTDEELSRMETISKCVTKGSLLISAGIVGGALASAVFLNPLPVYVGSAIGSGLAARQCFLKFREDREVRRPGTEVEHDAELEVCNEIQYKGQSTSDDNKRPCTALPPITEAGIKCIKIAKERKKAKEAEKEKDLAIRGSPLHETRFRKPGEASCTAKACLPTRDQSSADLEKEKDGKGHENKAQPKTETKEDFLRANNKRVGPLKRFTNPLRLEDVVTSEEALNETFRSAPLKRFSNNEKVIFKKKE